MKVDAQNYERMRSWLAVLAPELFPGHPPEIAPIKALDETFSTSPANARKGLAIAINDCIDFAGDWPTERVLAIDVRLSEQGLPTLSDMRTRFSRDIHRVVRRGRIASEVEYYAVRNAAELPDNDSDRLWQLLEAYENEVAP